MYLLTRPRPKLEASVSAFQQAGLDVVGVATSDITTIADAEAALSQYLATAVLPDAIIVTSVFAAHSLVRCVAEDDARALRSQLPIIAVGQATAEIVAPAFSQVITPQQHTSEGILALPLLKSAKCQHIVIIKGKGGRTALYSTLRTWQKQVNSFCVYQRSALEVPVTSRLFQFDAVSGIIATSEQLGQQLLQHYTEHAITDKPWVTVSERVAGALRKLGVPDIRVCAGASDSALIKWVKNNWE